MIILATLAEIETARGNGCESRGPGTAAGLARSSMNAFQQGRRSKKMARLDEDSIQFEIRHQSWLARLNPRGDVEEFLTEHIAVMACELDRAKKAHLDHLARLVEDSDERDVDAVHELGKKLYFDPCGLYGFAADNCKKHTSWNGTIGGEFDPDTLVRRLAKSAPGCDLSLFVAGYETGVMSWRLRRGRNGVSDWGRGETKNETPIKIEIMSMIMIYPKTTTLGRETP